MKLAEEPPEPDVEGVASRASSPTPTMVPSTAMERLLAEGVCTHSTIDIVLLG